VAYIETVQSPAGNEELRAMSPEFRDALTVGRPIDG
jgi:hypothetical protein